jgi:hypothetical protein
MEKHYICKGRCEGLSDTPGVCQTEDCADEGKPLKVCNCEDGLHEQMEEQEAEASNN